MKCQSLTYVKVSNQMTSLDDDCKFQSIKDLVPGTTRFNEVYGDCFISGESTVKNWRRHKHACATNLMPL